MQGATFTLAGTLRRDTVPFQHYRDGVHRNADDILLSRRRGERGSGSMRYQGCLR